MKIPSIGSEKAPITRDDSGDAIGGAGIIGIGGEKWRKGEDRSEIWNILPSQLRGRKGCLYIVQNFPN